MKRLASMTGSVTVSGDCTFLPAVYADQFVDEGACCNPVGIDGAVTLDESYWHALINPIRRTNARLVFEGIDVKRGRTGTLTVTKSIKTGDFQTMAFETTGPLFSMPTVDATPRPYEPCPPLPTVGPGGRSPIPWGNRDVEAFFRLGVGPLAREKKLFKGKTFQKSNSKDVGITAQFSCVDDAILYSKIPLCFELGPFSGMRRGEVVKRIAANVGIDPATVKVPLGSIVNKPILLSNGSLLPFLDEFGKPENWRFYFDVDGNLVGEEIALKAVPDWTFDASKGDYVYDSFSEQLPTSPPTDYYITASEPVDPNDDSDTRTQLITEELRELYVPEVVKVRPSGGSSFPYADGSYRSKAAQELMLVSRVKTSVTTKNGVPIREKTEREQFYNPAAYDPNLSGLPYGTSYDGAYGNKTFHKDEIESFQLVSEETVDSVLDTFGSLQQRTQRTRAWYSPRHAFNFFRPGTHDPEWGPINVVGSYLYAGAIARTDPREQLITVQEIQSSYTYGDDGTLSEELEDTLGWFDPQGACDIEVQVPDDPTLPPYVTPDTPPILNIPPAPTPVPPPTVTPPKPPPPVKTDWHPVITGPYDLGNQQGLASPNSHRLFFDVDVSSCPGLGGVTGNWNLLYPFVKLVGYDGTFTYHSASLVDGRVQANGPALSVFPQPFGDNKLKVFKKSIYFDVTDLLRPAHFAYAYLRVKATIGSGIEAGDYLSAELQFDPWATIPQNPYVQPPPPGVDHNPPPTVPCPPVGPGGTGGLLIYYGNDPVNIVSLPPFFIGKSYAVQLKVAAPGVAPFAWSVVNQPGTGLPTGVSLNPVTGLISGTPSGTIPIGVVIKVVDAKGCVGYH